jgi:phosphatidylinositol-3,4,5-trisphosphate 3-phosphatase/dual-specificity protein phosphatase PTEN
VLGSAGTSFLRSAVVLPSASGTPVANAANAPKITLAEVLASGSLLSDVKDAMEDVYGAHNFEFLESVQEWRDTLDELATSDARPAVRDAALYDGAVSIYTQFLDRASARDNLVNVPDDTIQLHTAKFALVQRRGKGKCDGALLNPQIFDDAVSAVHAYVEANLWPEFTTTDEYTMLCVSAAEAAARAPAAAAAAKAAQRALPASRTDYMDTVPRVPFPSQLTAPLPQWDYASNPYASLSLSVSSGRGPMASARGNNQLFILVTAGSSVLRGSQAPCMWGETFSLPVAPTLQCVTVAVCLGTKLVGFVPLTLAELVQTPALATPQWFTLRSGDGPLTAALSAAECPGVGARQDSPPSGNNELLFQWTLTKAEATPVVLQSDYVKAIYAEDTATGSLGDFIRNKVSKKKKRFTEDNFNLDLTYITPTVIAMGFPSEGTEGVYRNPLKQVQQFFRLRHPNAYRIYNLCSERAYEAGKFEDRVCRFPFDDHNPPPFTMIKQFCENARQFLSAHPQNVVSIHCKAGKGRTGTMIACLFVYLGLTTAHEALMLFGRQRTSNAKGVTIPSQIRYVRYFENYCALRRAERPPPGRTTLFLNKVLVRNIGKAFANAEVFFTILEPSQGDDDVGDASKEKLYSSRKLIDPVYYVNTDTLCWDLSKKLVDLNEDFRMEFAAKTGFGREKMFQCWLNTRFLTIDVSSGEPRVTVPKKELDKACKDLHNKRYPANMHLELVFSKTDTSMRLKGAELTVDTVAAAAAAAAAASAPTASDCAATPASPTAVGSTTGVTTTVAEEPSL